MAMSKTAAGHQVLKDRSVGLTPRQRAALILIDGQRSVEDVLGVAAGVGRGDIDRLVALGLVADEPGDSYPVPLLTEVTPATSARDRYVRAYLVASELVSVWSKDGQLTLAVESAGTLEELRALAPRIRGAVGPARFAALDAALGPA